MKPLATITLITAALLLTPTVVIAGEGHNHNHFNPALEASGNDIIGLTVCYNNGFVSDPEQQIAFENLVANAGVSGEELGMFYMNSLGQKAEAIMADPDGSALWSAQYCSDLVADYSTPENIDERGHHPLDGHDHGHGELDAETVATDIERGRLLPIK
ncbi:hypothetical protein SIN8267_01343 [Sinobacterium norvegicum]|uniref:Uncharacterized protein n=1 Tax=Sinobacterium norvegicum TaxID=1641715 RepID=A0ABN8EMC7_9GAMM|nr:hypothetical protein [Sinobacterium norvegicum]CAH0991241.1 hypothetical protein SIN8267_01343 [Sinobacterium norvegicum]